MSWSPPAVSQADIDLLTNLNHHLLHAANISRSIALRWGIKPLDPEALGLSSFDRAEHDHPAKRHKQPPYPRPYPIAPPPDGPSLERTRPYDGPNSLPYNAHSWRHSSPVHRSDEAHSDAIVSVRRRSSEHPSSVPSPNHLPDSESDRTIEACPSQNCKPVTASNEDDDMSLDEMILNVADGEESAGGKTIKAPQHQSTALMIEARTPTTGRESYTDRRKNRNNSNQHGQLRAIAHRVPQPIADPLPADPNSRTHNSTPSLLAYPPSIANPESRSITPHTSTLDYRFSTGTGAHASALSPPIDSSFGTRGTQDRNAHIAFAPLHGPDSIGVDHERSVEAHHVRKPPPVNERICSQCGRPGRLKDGRSVEKWGPGPDGPGTVCDRCRKKMKRVEKRSTADPALITPNNTRADGMADSSSARYSRSPEIDRVARHGAENNNDSSSLPYHPPHPPSHAPFSQPKPSFLSRDNDPILDALEDSRYPSSNNIQPVSDIRSESSAENIHSRGKDRGGRPKGKDTGRARRRAPSFSPSRSPSPHSILEHTNSPPAPLSHKRSKSLSSSHPPADDASSLLEQELLETASHPSHSRTHDRDFDSDTTTTQFRKDPQISPVGSASDGTVVDGIAFLGSSTAPSSAAPNSFPNGDCTAQPAGSPLSPASSQPVSNAHPLARSVLGKRRSPPDGDATASDIECQRQKKGEVMISSDMNGAVPQPQPIAQQPDAHDFLTSTYASDGVDATG